MILFYSPKSDNLFICKFSSNLLQANKQASQQSQTQTIRITPKLHLNLGYKHNSQSGNPTIS